MLIIYTDKSYEKEDRLRFINYLSYEIFNLKKEIGEIKGWENLYKMGLGLIPKVPFNFDFFEKFHIKRLEKNANNLEFLERYFYVIKVEEASLVTIDQGLKTNKNKKVILTDRIDLDHLKEVVAVIDKPSVTFIQSNSVILFNSAIEKYLNSLIRTPIKKGTSEKTLLDKLILQFNLGTTIF